MVTKGDILTKVFKNGHYQKDQIKSTLNYATKIFKKIPNSENDITSNVGLVVGRVQSGKTANIITLAGLVLDNGFRLIVIFLSDTNNLLDQNYDRIKNSFSGIDDVHVIKKSKDGDFDTTIDTQTLNYLYGQGKKLIICSLKHSKHINEVSKVISSSPFAKDYSLIIDDEGDDIGLNGIGLNDKKGGPKFIEDKKTGNLIETNRTSTNKAIVRLKNSLNKVGYISLTATPEANILLQDIQQLAPDFCVTLEPNKGYTGLLSFHGENSDKVQIISDHSDLLQNNGLPKSFEEAFNFYVAGCILRHEREPGTKHSMMIHPCNTNDNQQLVYEKVHDYVDNIMSNVERNNQSGQLFIKKVSDVYNSLGGSKIINQDAVKGVTDFIKIHLVNSKSSTNDLKKAMALLPFHVIVGGNMLDRGITIDGLAVTYMIRMSQVGQADTLLQRARWFGYKESYFDLCRVYLPQALNDQFESLIGTEESVWQFLYECSENDLSPKEQQPLFDVPSNLRIAAKNKGAYVMTNLASFVKTQNIVVFNPQYNSDNINLIKSIPWANSKVKVYNSVQTHNILSMSVVDFRNLFKQYHFSDKEDGLTWDVLDTLLKNLNQQNVDIWDMRPKTKENRSTNDYKIKALLQGRSEGKLIGDPDYYVGDRNLQTDCLSIQIHHVLLKNDIENKYNKGDEVIMLAAVLPKGYIGGSVAKRMNKKQIKNQLK